MPAILTSKALTVAALARWPLIGQFVAHGIEGIEPITEANNREFKQLATAAQIRLPEVSFPQIETRTPVVSSPHSITGSVLRLENLLKIRK